MKLLVCFDSLLEFLLAHIAPRTDRVTHDLDVKVRHSPQSGTEHAQMQEQKERENKLL